MELTRQCAATSDSLYAGLVPAYLSHQEVFIEIEQRTGCVGFAMLKEVEDSVAEPIVPASFSRLSSGAADLKHAADEMAQNIIRRRTGLISSRLRMAAELEESLREFDFREATNIRHLVLEHIRDVENIVSQHKIRADEFKQQLTRSQATSKYPSASERRFVRRQDARAIGAAEKMVKIAASYIDFLKHDILGTLDERLRKAFVPGRSAEEIAAGLIKRYPVVLEQLAR